MKMANLKRIYLEHDISEKETKGKGHFWNEQMKEWLI